jgi:hypothetical protein
MQSRGHETQAEKAGAMSLITLPKVFLGTPSVLPQNQSIALSLTNLAAIHSGAKAPIFSV